MKNILRQLAPLCWCWIVLGQAGVLHAQVPDEELYLSKKYVIGDTVTDLKGESPDGIAYSLKEVNKGRYVLVDFWASWCKPCRIGNPKLVKRVKDLEGKKFRNAPKGFTVFSVSLDMKPEPWKKAIKDDKLDWEYHISDLGGWESALAALFGVEIIPQVFLLDPEGRVIFKSLEAAHAIEALKKYIE